MNEMIENCFSLNSDSETKIEEKCKQVQNILDRQPRSPDDGLANHEFGIDRNSLK